MTKDVFGEMWEHIRHRGNPDLLVCNIRSDSDIENMARRYWRGVNTGNDVLTEALFREFYRVTRVVR